MSGSGDAVVRILCVGDVVGRPGRRACTKLLTSLRRDLNIDLIVVNGENAAGGVGIDPTTATEIREAGADVITLGDHTWNRKEAKDFLAAHSDWCIRPANYPAGAPGKGWTIATTTRGQKVGIFNLLGRTFLNLPLDCPFKAAEQIVSGPLKDTQIRVLDCHGEATSEKIAMGRFLDGRVSLQVGTHTHVQTADEQVFPKGLGYITDLGMTGSQDGVIGMDSETALGRFLTALPQHYKPASGVGVVCGVVGEIELVTGRAKSVTRVRVAAPPDEV